MKKKEFFPSQNHHPSRNIKYKIDICRSYEHNSCDKKPALTNLKQLLKWNKPPIMR